ncbi:MAG: 4Fe-4S binding protein [Actinobacteria bacterium]|nr:4Fe-4S binding protein [Actinomycetota bacterium]
MARCARRTTIAVEKDRRQDRRDRQGVSHQPGLSPYHRCQSLLYIRDLSKCISCGLCVRACLDVQGAGTYEMRQTGAFSAPPYAGTCR